MGEIKSAVELAMERTKNLVMDDEERRAFARKDREDKIRALMRRFLEGMIEGEEFLRDYGAIPGDRVQKRLLLLDLLEEEFQGSSENERLFALLELLAEESGGGLSAEARELRGWFQKELTSKEAGIRQRIVDRLKEIGISGSAVEPNVAEWEESRDAARDIGSLVTSRLREWKEKLHAQTL